MLAICEIRTPPTGFLPPLQDSVLGFRAEGIRAIVHPPTAFTPPTMLQDITVYSNWFTKITSFQPKYGIPVIDIDSHWYFR